MRMQAAVHDLTVEAALTGSRDVALQALLVDPLVDSAKRAEELLDTMLELQTPYLEYIA
jgi:alpha-galactosidase